jgi:hypothetical protein
MKTAAVVDGSATLSLFFLPHDATKSNEARQARGKLRREATQAILAPFVTATKVRELPRVKMRTAAARFFNICLLAVCL